MTEPGHEPSRSPSRSWLGRPSTVVAPELLGLILARPGEGTSARIVEVEAYSQTDPACHAHRGCTPRNATLFGPAGHSYLYFTYGMHWCANVVTGPEGVGEGVLVRAAVPLTGIEVMQARRASAARPVAERDLMRGPARAASAMGLDRTFDGMDLLSTDSALRLLDDGVRPAAISSGPRVGVRLAAELPWRHWVTGDPHVSPYRRHPRAEGVRMAGR